MSDPKISSLIAMASIIPTKIHAIPPPLEIFSFMKEDILSSSLWWDLEARVMELSRLYGVQVLLIFILILITIFRREISCNHEYFCESEGVGVSENYNAGKAKITTEEMLHELRIKNSNRINTSAKSAHRNASNLGSNQSQCPYENKFTNYSMSNNYLLTHLPSDIQVHLLSFLNPKDLAVFSCVSRYSNGLACHPLLWKTLFLRDYNYILTQWPLAQTAFQRFSPDSPFTIIEFLSKRIDEIDEEPFDMKQLYFTFTKYWIDWSIAGLNSFNSCYIGLHNCIFNITDFIRDHPGSPETILMYAGRDATEIFEDLGHSMGARDIASKRLCEVNLGYNYYGCSKKKEAPSRYEMKKSKNHQKDEKDVALPMMRCKNKRKSPGVLLPIKRKFEYQEKLEQLKIKEWRKTNPDIEILAEVNIYFDPFYQKWRWWYSDYNLEVTHMTSVG